MCPWGNGGLYDVYWFLIATEIDWQYNMCFLFSYDLKKNKFSEPVKQFMGIDCIFIGSAELDIPGVVVLQDDMRTIVITELSMKTNKGLPWGEIKLGTMIKGIYSTPFWEGLAIIYVSQNTIKFSNNRLAENPISDYSLMKSNTHTFKLNYEEIVFHIEWNASSTDPELL